MLDATFIEGPDILYIQVWEAFLASIWSNMLLATNRRNAISHVKILDFANMVTLSTLLHTLVAFSGSIITSIIASLVNRLDLSLWAALCGHFNNMAHLLQFPVTHPLGTQWTKSSAVCGFFRLLFVSLSLHWPSCRALGHPQPSTHFEPTTGGSWSRLYRLLMCIDK